MNRIEALNVLGLDSDATEKDIKVAYRECAQILHPDRFASNAKLQDRATEQFKRLQDAYEYLTGDKARRTSASGSWSSAPSGAKASYRAVEARLAGLAAAKSQLTAQRDALSDERRNAIIMIVGGAIVALAARRIVILAGVASALAVYGIVSLVGTMQNIGTIDEHLKDMEMQRRRLEEELEEE
ncbi:J domain-containing protein [Slackia exigua]|uniref:J domain-containing protein n=1 Tax=Slackia exigua TaxID=84109 RepID=UPI0023F0734F|nr:DnaJ domain-containing protein [Slackia exigua]